jgi:membrane peptidoglycan carboxypeptidase
VDLQRLIAALPEQLQPAEDAPHVHGPIRLELHARGPLKRPAEWVTTLDLDTAALKENARNAPLVLRGPFSYKPTGGEGPGRTLWIGGKGASYVPIGELPPIVGLAVTTSEDAGFYAHQGFDLEGLQNGLAAAMGGSKLRGGSTLTQQLVKNIYLSSERTMARKITEALITIQVEAALPKQRILEVYLNIIEWGPGVYGIGEAARYYFGIDARSLNTKQAVFLASIIPNPTHWGPAFRHSGLTEAWNQRLAGILQTLHQRGNLGDAQYQRALDEPLVFRGESESATLTRGQ